MSNNAPLLDPHNASRDCRHTDIILSMQPDPYIPQILQGQKTHEFRKYPLPESTRRVWMYITAPVSAIKYICTIGPATVRGAGVALPENGIGNVEFNSRGGGWKHGGYAYELLDVCELPHEIGLPELKQKYGLKGPPRRWLYLPEKIEREKILSSLKRIR